MDQSLLSNPFAYIWIGPKNGLKSSKQVTFFTPIPIGISVLLADSKSFAVKQALHVTSPKQVKINFVSNSGLLSNMAKAQVSSFDYKNSIITISSPISVSNITGVVVLLASVFVSISLFV